METNRPSNAPEQDWTLERELCRLGGDERLLSALAALGLPPGQISRRDTEWRRGGSETFLFGFSLSSRGSTLQLLIKACAAYSPGLDSVEEIIASWVQRRAVLSSAGIPTPTLYYHGMGVILEEFIPKPVKASDITGETLIRLAALARVLSDQGFSPTSGFFSDVRLRNGEVVPVDFGSDLGPPGALNRGSHSPLRTLLRSLTMTGVSLEPSAIDLLSATFNIQPTEAATHD